MSKQTALQILVESMTTSDVSFYSKEIAIALQMEREQIIDAYTECWSNDGGNPFHKVKEAEQFYNERYGGNK